jgi:hypothetical protein
VRHAVAQNSQTDPSHSDVALSAVHTHLGTAPDARNHLSTLQVEALACATPDGSGTAALCRGEAAATRDER